MVDVRSGARPGMIFSAVDHLGTDGVHIGVDERIDQACGAKGAGVEAILPEVSAVTGSEVEALGVDQVGLADGQGHGAFVAGDGNQVDMVGHQAIAKDAKVVFAALAVEGLEVEEAVGVGAENSLAVIAALGDVVR